MTTSEGRWRCGSIEETSYTARGVFWQLCQGLCSYEERLFDNVAFEPEGEERETRVCCN
jgi:hypothetical protein